MLVLEGENELHIDALEAMYTKKRRVEGSITKDRKIDGLEYMLSCCVCRLLFFADVVNSESNGPAIISIIILAAAPLCVMAFYGDGVGLVCCVMVQCHLTSQADHNEIFCAVERRDKCSLAIIHT